MWPTALGHSLIGTGLTEVQGSPKPQLTTIVAHHSVLLRVCPNPVKYVVVGQQS